MDITYLGHSSFKIVASGSAPGGVKQKVAVVTDPFDSKMVGIKFSPTDAEVITVSHNHPDHSSTDKIGGAKKIIDGPGEYEVAGVSMMGYATYHDDKKGEERGKNTIYVYEVEGLRIAHLGDLGHVLSDNLIQEIGDLDVLIIPVGGFYTIGPKEAMAIISKIEPYFVIPMHYKVDGMSKYLSEKLLPVEDFLKESGLTVENSPKFTIKKEDIIEDQTTKVIVLETK